MTKTQTNTTIGWGFDDLESMLRHRPLSDVMRVAEVRAWACPIDCVPSVLGAALTEVLPRSMP